MSDLLPDSPADHWSDWLLHRRHADDPAYDQQLRAIIERYADRVLDGAGLSPGITLADVGCGDGLIALRAIGRVGPGLQAVLVDLSAPLLRLAEARAVERGVRGQCRFVEASAEHLRGIDDASVDVVTTRAVLAYVGDKAAALRECLRILKPGGRLSIAEPVFRDEALAANALRQALAPTGSGAADRFLRLLHRVKSAQFPDTEAAIARAPLVNFTERDLFSAALAAGFAAVHLELHLDARPALARSWAAFLGSSPHPLAPSPGAVMAEQFNAEERAFFEQVLRPTIERGNGVEVDRVAYLTAMRPLALA